MKLLVWEQSNSGYKIAVQLKGSAATKNSVKQMLKNWKRQGLITSDQPSLYHKTQS